MLITPRRRPFLRAVYVDELNATQLPFVPPNMLVRRHADFQSQVGADYSPNFGFRGAALFLDLYRLFPSALWYVSGDDDTFFGRPWFFQEPGMQCMAAWVLPLLPSSAGQQPRPAAHARPGGSGSRIAARSPACP
jgi:hypothetical protein